MLMYFKIVIGLHLRIIIFAYPMVWNKYNYFFDNKEKSDYLLLNNFPYHMFIGETYKERETSI